MTPLPRTAMWLLPLLLVGLFLAGPTDAARQFNGTNQSLQSGTVDLTAYQKVALSFWFWANDFANGGNAALVHGVTYTTGNGSFVVVPDYSAGDVLVGHFGDVGNALSRFARPSAAAWHHYVVNLDKSKASAEVDSVYVDGVSQSLTVNNNSNNTNTFATGNVNVMSNNNTSLFYAGRFAELAIWGGLLLSSGEASTLYNGGNGTLATNVQPGSVVLYCRVLGVATPETCLIGGTSLTVNGLAQGVGHPFLDPISGSRRPARKFGR